MYIYKRVHDDNLWNIWYVLENSTNKLSFQRSRVDGCLYILYREGNGWVKLINYVDDALSYASSDKVREDFKLSL